MAAIVITVAATFIFVVVAVVVLAMVKTPYYQLDGKRVKLLLELVLSGQATDNDWAVFTSVPLRHDELLESIRLECLQIEEHYYSETLNKPYLFTDEGLEQLRHQLNRLHLALDKNA